MKGTITVPLHSNLSTTKDNESLTSHAPPSILTVTFAFSITMHAQLKYIIVSNRNQVITNMSLEYSRAKDKTNGPYNNPYVQITTPNSASDTRSNDKVLDVLNRFGKKMEDVTRKAEALAGGLKDHLKFSPSLSDATMARLAHGTKMFIEGGPERMFQREFGVLAAEKLLDSFVCYLSTTSGPVTGILYVSNRRITFCSDYAIRSAGKKDAPTYYKVVMELEKIRTISPSVNVMKPSERYVNVVTHDGFEFWFMGFVSYMDAFKCLNKALLSSRCNHSVM